MVPDYSSCLENIRQHSFHVSLREDSEHLIKQLVPVASAVLQALGNSHFPSYNQLDQFSDAFKLLPLGGCIITTRPSALRTSVDVGQRVCEVGGALNR